MGRLPLGVCHDFFAGFCARVNCPLRHVDDESILIRDDAKPSSPVRQPTTASTPAEPLSLPTGVDEPLRGGSDVPAAVGVGDAPESSAVVSELSRNNGLQAADGGIARCAETDEKSRDGQGLSKPKLCQNFRKTGFCLENLSGSCLMYHPEPGEDYDVGSDEDDVPPNTVPPVQCPPCPADQEMLPVPEQAPVSAPNGPQPTVPSPVPIIPDEIDDVDDLPSEPDDASPPSTPTPKSPSKILSSNASSPTMRSPEHQAPQVSVESPSKRRKPPQVDEDLQHFDNSTMRHGDSPKAQDNNQVHAVGNKVADMTLEQSHLSNGLTRTNNVSSTGDDVIMEEQPPLPCFTSASSRMGMNMEQGDQQDDRDDAVMSPHHRGGGQRKRNAKHHRNRGNGRGRGRGGRRGRGGQVPDAVVSMPKTAHEVATKNKYFCVICQVDCMSAMSLQSHEKGKAHRRKASARQFDKANLTLEEEYRHRSRPKESNPEGNPIGADTEHDPASAAVPDAPVTTDETPSADVTANGSPARSSSPTSVTDRSGDEEVNGPASNAVLPDSPSSPKAGTRPDTRGHSAASDVRQVSTGAKSDIAKGYDSDADSDREGEGMNGSPKSRPTFSEKTSDGAVGGMSVDLRTVVPSDLVAAADTEPPTIGTNIDEQPTANLEHNGKRKLRGTSRFTDIDPNVFADAQLNSDSNTAAHVARPEEGRESRNGSRFKSADILLEPGEKQNSNAERTRNTGAPSTRVSTVSQATPTFVPFQDIGVPQVTPMDTSNDTACPVSEPMNIVGDDGNKNAEDHHLVSNPTANSGNVKYQEFKFARMDEPPSRVDLMALRDLAESSGSAMQTFTFKIFMELLLSPTIGIPLDDVEKLMEYLDKVPLNLRKDDVTKTPVMFAKDLDPKLLLKKSNVPTEYDGDEDGKMKKAVDLFSDNVEYLLMNDVTSGESKFCDFTKNQRRQTRGRSLGPVFKIEDGEVRLQNSVPADDITVDPAFVWIQQCIGKCNQQYGGVPPPQ